MKKLKKTEQQQNAAWVDHCVKRVGEARGRDAA